MTATLRACDLHVGDVAAGTAYEVDGPVVHIERFGFGGEHCAICFADGVEAQLVWDCPIGGAW